MSGVAVSRILPPKVDHEAPVTTSLRVPPPMLKELDEIAKESGYTRTEVMLHFWTWAIQEYRREQREKVRAKK